MAPPGGGTSPQAGRPPKKIFGKKNRIKDQGSCTSISDTQPEPKINAGRDQNQNAKILGFEKLPIGGISPQTGRHLRQMMPGGKSAKSMEEKDFRQSIGQIIKKARWLAHV